jgi:hypothetical protein
MTYLVVPVASVPTRTPRPEDVYPEATLLPLHTLHDTCAAATVRTTYMYRVQHTQRVE